MRQGAVQLILQHAKKPIDKGSCHCRDEERFEHGIARMARDFHYDSIVSYLSATVEAAGYQQTQRLAEGTASRRFMAYHTVRNVNFGRYDSYRLDESQNVADDR